MTAGFSQPEARTDCFIKNAKNAERMRSPPDAMTNVLAAFNLIPSALFLAGVVERWAAAAWMTYKFIDTPTASAVTLSLGTAKAYSLAALALTATGLYTLRLSRNRAMRAAEMMSLIPLVASTVGLALYWGLGLSPLNQWVP